MKIIIYVILIFLFGCSNESYSGIAPYEACTHGSDCAEENSELVFTDAYGNRSMWVCDDGIWLYQGEK
jgi:tricorn protease-like protein